jgi:uncharacterized protein YbjQ (UPF0145 family)
MIKLITPLLISCLFFMAPQAYGRDSTHFFSIQAAMDTTDFQQNLDPDIKFYFGNQTHAAVERSFGTYTSNKKTNAFNKSDEEACQRSFLNALLTFQQRAKNEGGNAVVEVESYYKKKPFSSETEYECHAGAVIAGTALRGKVVKLAE